MLFSTSVITSCMLFLLLSLCYEYPDTHAAQFPAYEGVQSRMFSPQDQPNTNVRASELQRQDLAGNEEVHRKTSLYIID